MTFLKYILSFLLSIFFVSAAAIAQQPNASYEVEWLGFNASQQLKNGEIVTYPMAKDAVIDVNGILVLQKDVNGKIAGSVSMESVSYYAGDSASKSALNKLTYEGTSTITYAYLYNKGITSRICIPLLKKNSDGTWSQISSFSLSYTLTSSADDTPIQQKNPYTNAYSNARTTSTTGSVLATGSWFKLGVSQTGIYKIDAAYLSSIGINTSTLDPAMIQIYGNGGGMLPQANNAARLDDLVENAIFISEDGNGVFDHNDYILFYGESPHTWTYDGLNKTYAHALNLYSDQNFYFLTYGQQTGKRIASQASIASTAQTLSEFDEHLFSETDTYNILDSGREWYGFQFSPYIPSFSTAFNVTGLVSGSTMTLSTDVISRSYNATYMGYKINNSSLSPDLTLPILSTAEHAPLGIDASTTYSFNASLVGANSTLTVDMNFSGGIASSLAHTNWLELRFLKSLRLYGNQTFFRASKSLLQATTSYSIGNTDGTEQIWNLSDPQNIVSQNYTVVGSTIEFGANTTALNEYVVFKGSAFGNPVFVERVANQNLHDITSSNMPDMIIVTHPDFLSQAQHLANYRFQNDGISSYVCTTNQIYNEFGSGKADITAIRDFVKMVYDRGTPGAELKYLLLFGSCTYDYKNHLGIGGNFVPPYESRESLDELRSYNSDDYYGFMDAAEGNWGESPAEYNTLNIGVGRIPVRTSYQADVIINKLISASKASSQVNGNWENKMTLIADDGDTNLHLNDAEYIYTKVNTSNKQMNINKIYLDAYSQESTPGGETATQVNTAINRDVDDGTLIWNYIGHGGNIALAQENIVNIPSINSWVNNTKLGFYITATCSFGRYDKPGLTSGAETIFLSPTGGSFANLTSTRTVYASTNAMINRAFYDYAFLRNTDGSFYCLGDIIMRTKNKDITASDVYNRNYSLLGDPSMKIRYPQQNMIITSVNGTAVNAIPDTLKALSKVTLEGLVQDFSGTTLTSYNGLAKITIYDKPTTLATFGTNSSPVTTFKLQSNIIFDGLATVTNGAYKVSFIVPKDISYQYDYGKISLYSELTSGTTDAGGYLSNIVIGGSNANAPNDQTPPTVKLYLNDPSFVSGGTTRENPIFYANVADENGINVSAAGIGHEITLVLSTSTDVIILNKYYTAAQDDYSKGKVEFPLKDLAPGTYSLRFKVWDTYNNSTEQTLEFTIQSTEKLQLSHVLNYPNPFSTNTTFHFDHNRAGDNLMIQIQIFTVSGKLVKTLDETIYNSPSHVASLFWNGLDDFGDKIGRGVYVYKVKIRSLQDGSTTHVFEKLVLLN
ncbi:type IX secretion system sortase PorU [Cytophaga aurantiaca]|uniref:type IX secretion system sortase PorU n=1 Tax=Cytophaga aurantiaca TaxID=29530 RepID=UPI000378E21A|nr:type IX secretion system sortase PorU [Cytophaga aurantiaca]